MVEGGEDNAKPNPDVKATTPEPVKTAPKVGGNGIEHHDVVAPDPNHPSAPIVDLSAPESRIAAKRTGQGDPIQLGGVPEDQARLHEQQMLATLTAAQQGDQPVKATVQMGDITKIEGAMVLTTINLSGSAEGAVDFALEQAFGTQFHDQLQQHIKRDADGRIVSELPLGSVFITRPQGADAEKATGVNFKGVIFAVDDPFGNKNPEPLRDVITRGLLAADAAGETRVVMPTIGFGNAALFGSRKANLAEEWSEGIVNALAKSKNLKEVTLSVYDGKSTADSPLPKGVQQLYDKYFANIPEKVAQRRAELAAKGEAVETKDVATPVAAENVDQVRTETMAKLDKTLTHIAETSAETKPELARVLKQLHDAIEPLIAEHPELAAQKVAEWLRERATDPAGLFAKRGQSTYIKAIASEIEQSGDPAKSVRSVEALAQLNNWIEKGVPDNSGAPVQSLKYAEKAQERGDTELADVVRQNALKLLNPDTAPEAQKALTTAATDYYTHLADQTTDPQDKARYQIIARGLSSDQPMVVHEAAEMATTFDPHAQGDARGPVQFLNWSESPKVTYEGMLALKDYIDPKDPGQRWPGEADGERAHRLAAAMLSVGMDEATPIGLKGPARSMAGDAILAEAATKGPNERAFLTKAGQEIKQDSPNLDQAVHAYTGTAWHDLPGREASEALNTASFLSNLGKDDPHSANSRWGVRGREAAFGLLSDDPGVRENAKRELNQIAAQRLLIDAPNMTGDQRSNAERAAVLLKSGEPAELKEASRLIASIEQERDGEYRPSYLAVDFSAHDPRIPESIFGSTRDVMEGALHQFDQTKEPVVVRDNDGWIKATVDAHGRVNAFDYYKGDGMNPLRSMIESDGTVTDWANQKWTEHKPDGTSTVLNSSRGLDQRTGTVTYGPPPFGKGQEEERLDGTFVRYNKDGGASITDRSDRTLVGIQLHENGANAGTAEISYTDFERRNNSDEASKLASKMVLTDPDGKQTVFRQDGNRIAVQLPGQPEQYIDGTGTMQASSAQEGGVTLILDRNGTRTSVDLSAHNSVSEFMDQVKALPAVATGEVKSGEVQRTTIGGDALPGEPPPKPVPPSEAMKDMQAFQRQLDGGDLQKLASDLQRRIKYSVDVRTTGSYSSAEMKFPPGTSYTDRVKASILEARSRWPLDVSFSDNGDVHYVKSHSDPVMELRDKEALDQRRQASGVRYNVIEHSSGSPDIKFIDTDPAKVFPAAVAEARTRVDGSVTVRIGEGKDELYFGYVSRVSNVSELQNRYNEMRESYDGNSPEQVAARTQAAKFAEQFTATTKPIGDGNEYQMTFKGQIKPTLEEALQAAKAEAIARTTPKTVAAQVHFNLDGEDFTATTSTDVYRRLAERDASVARQRDQVERAQWLPVRDQLSKQLNYDVLSSTKTRAELSFGPQSTPEQRIKAAIAEAKASGRTVTFKFDDTRAVPDAGTTVRPTDDPAKVEADYLKTWAQHVEQKQLKAAEIPALDAGASDTVKSMAAFNQQLESGQMRELAEQLEARLSYTHVGSSLEFPEGTSYADKLMASTLEARAHGESISFEHNGDRIRVNSDSNPVDKLQDQEALDLRRQASGLDYKVFESSGGNRSLVFTSDDPAKVFPAAIAEAAAKADGAIDISINGTRFGSVTKDGNPDGLLTQYNLRIAAAKEARMRPSRVEAATPAPTAGETAAIETAQREAKLAAQQNAETDAAKLRDQLYTIAEDKSSPGNFVMTFKQPPGIEDAINAAKNEAIARGGTDGNTTVSFTVDDVQHSISATTSVYSETRNHDIEVHAREQRLSQAQDRAERDAAIPERDRLAKQLNYSVRRYDHMESQISFPASTTAEQRIKAALAEAKASGRSVMFRYDNLDTNSSVGTVVGPHSDQVRATADYLKAWNAHVATKSNTVAQGDLDAYVKKVANSDISQVASDLKADLKYWKVNETGDKYSSRKTIDFPPNTSLLDKMKAATIEAKAMGQGMYFDQNGDQLYVGPNSDAVKLLKQYQEASVRRGDMPYKIREFSDGDFQFTWDKNVDYTQGNRAEEAIKATIAEAAARGRSTWLDLPGGLYGKVDSKSNPNELLASFNAKVAANDAAARDMAAGAQEAAPMRAELGYSVTKSQYGTDNYDIDFSKVATKPSVEQVVDAAMAERQALGAGARVSVKYGDTYLSVDNKTDRQAAIKDLGQQVETRQQLEEAFKLRKEMGYKLDWETDRNRPHRLEFRPDTDAESRIKAALTEAKGLERDVLFSYGGLTTKVSPNADIAAETKSYLERWSEHTQTESARVAALTGQPASDVKTDGQRQLDAFAGRADVDLQGAAREFGSNVKYTVEEVKHQYSSSDRVMHFKGDVSLVDKYKAAYLEAKATGEPMLFDNNGDTLCVSPRLGVTGAYDRYQESSQRRAESGLDYKIQESKWNRALSFAEGTDGMKASEVVAAEQKAVGGEVIARIADKYIGSLKSGGDPAELAAFHEKMLSMQGAIDSARALAATDATRMRTDLGYSLTPSTVIKDQLDIAFNPAMPKPTIEQAFDAALNEAKASGKTVKFELDGVTKYINDKSKRDESIADFHKEVERDKWQAQAQKYRQELGYQVQRATSNRAADFITFPANTDAQSRIRAAVAEARSRYDGRPVSFSYDGVRTTVNGNEDPAQAESKYMEAWRQHLTGKGVTDADTRSATVPQRDTTTAPGGRDTAVTAVSTVVPLDAAQQKLYSTLEAARRGSVVSIPEGTDKATVDVAARKLANDKSQPVRVKTADGYTMYLPDSTKADKAGEYAYDFSRTTNRGGPVQVKLNDITINAGNQRWEKFVKDHPVTGKTAVDTANFYADKYREGAFNVRSIQELSRAVTGTMASPKDLPPDTFRVPADYAVGGRGVVDTGVGETLRQMAANAHTSNAPEIEVGILATRATRALGRPITVEKVGADGNVVGTFTVKPTGDIFDVADQWRGVGNPDAEPFWTRKATPQERFDYEVGEASRQGVWYPPKEMDQATIDRVGSTAANKRGELILARTDADTVSYLPDSKSQDVREQAKEAAFAAIASSRETGLSRVKVVMNGVTIETGQPGATTDVATALENQYVQRKAVLSRMEEISRSVGGTPEEFERGVYRVPPTEQGPQMARLAQQAADASGHALSLQQMAYDGLKGGVINANPGDTVADTSSKVLDLWHKASLKVLGLDSSMPHADEVALGYGQALAFDATAPVRNGDAVTVKTIYGQNQFKLDAGGQLTQAIITNKDGSQDTYLRDGDNWRIKGKGFFAKGGTVFENTTASMEPDGTFTMVSREPNNEESFVKRHPNGVFETGDNRGRHSLMFSNGADISRTEHGAGEVQYSLGGPSSDRRHSLTLREQGSIQSAERGFGVNFPDLLRQRSGTEPRSLTGEPDTARGDTKLTATGGRSIDELPAALRSLRLPVLEGRDAIQAVIDAHDQNSDTVAEKGARQAIVNELVSQLPDAMKGGDRAVVDWIGQMGRLDRAGVTYDAKGIAGQLEAYLANRAAEGRPDTEAGTYLKTAIETQIANLRSSVGSFGERTDTIAASYANKAGAEAGTVSPDQLLSGIDARIAQEKVQLLAAAQKRAEPTETVKDLVVEDGRPIADFHPTMGPFKEMAQEAVLKAKSISGPVNMVFNDQRIEVSPNSDANDLWLDRLAKLNPSHADALSGTVDERRARMSDLVSSLPDVLKEPEATRTAKALDWLEKFTLLDQDSRMNVTLEQRQAIAGQIQSVFSGDLKTPEGMLSYYASEIYKGETLRTGVIDFIDEYKAQQKAAALESPRNGARLAETPAKAFTPGELGGVQSSLEEAQRMLQGRFANVPGVAGLRTDLQNLQEALARTQAPGADSTEAAKLVDAWNHKISELARDGRLGIMGDSELEIRPKADFAKPDPDHIPFTPGNAESWKNLVREMVSADDHGMPKGALERMVDYARINYVSTVNQQLQAAARAAEDGSGPPFTSDAILKILEGAKTGTLDKYGALNGWIIASNPEKIGRAVFDAFKADAKSGLSDRTYEDMVKKFDDTFNGGTRQLEPSRVEVAQPAAPMPSTSERLEPAAILKTLAPQLDSATPEAAQLLLTQAAHDLGIVQADVPMSKADWGNLAKLLQTQASELESKGDSQSAAALRKAALSARKTSMEMKTEVAPAAELGAGVDAERAVSAAVNRGEADTAMSDVLAWAAHPEREEQIDRFTADHKGREGSPDTRAEAHQLAQTLYDQYKAEAVKGGGRGIGGLMAFDMFQGWVFKQVGLSLIP